jgi:hypothetical protein
MSDSVVVETHEKEVVEVKLSEIHCQMSDSVAVVETHEEEVVEVELSEKEKIKNTRRELTEEIYSIVDTVSRMDPKSHDHAVFSLSTCVDDLTLIREAVTLFRKGPKKGPISKSQKAMAVQFVFAGRTQVTLVQENPTSHQETELLRWFKASKIFNEEWTFFSSENQTFVAVAVPPSGMSPMDFRDLIFKASKKDIHRNDPVEEEEEDLIFGDDFDFDAVA